MATSARVDVGTFLDARPIGARQWLVLLLGYFVHGVSPGGYALSAQFYPTRMRATGVSWATGIGRLGAISGAGLGALILAANWNFSQVFLFLAVPALLGVLAQYLKGREVRPAPLAVAAI